MNWFIKALKQYADFSGRARRKEYWMFILFFFIFYLITVFVSGMIGSFLPAGIFILAMIIPSLAVSVRRMHDSNRAGWFILVPIYSFYLSLISGTQGSNDYGPDPKSGNDFNSEAIDSHMTN